MAVTPTASKPQKPKPLWPVWLPWLAGISTGIAVGCALLLIVPKELWMHVLAVAAPVALAVVRVSEWNLVLHYHEPTPTPAPEADGIGHPLPDP